MRKIGSTKGVILSLSLAVPMLGQSIQTSAPFTPHAPPSPPPVQTVPLEAPFSANEVGPLQPQSATAGFYDIGNPTAEEQLYLEMANRARANPSAEAQRLKNATDIYILGAYQFYVVDTNLLVTQLSGIPAAPPLAFNPKLITAARKHSQDMFDNAFQGHNNSSDGQTGDIRVKAEGYIFQTFAENVYSFANNVAFGHAGFEVDWGPGPGGMQTPPGHRNNIHNAVLREIGVGVVDGVNTIGDTSVGPQLVTEDFGTVQNSTPFLTGVAYDDLNGNGFYDIGEGISGVTFTVAGQNVRGLSTASGGYAVPLPGNGNYSLTISVPGLPDTTRTVTIQNNQNAKVDFTPTYQPPVITGPLNPSIGASNQYTFNGVAGAISYDLQMFQVKPALVEGGENGTAALTLQTNGGYNAFDTGVKASGTHSIHLVHMPPPPGQGPVPQSFSLSPLYFVGQNAAIQFQSRLGFAEKDEKAIVAVSTDDGANWQTVYSQDGASDATVVPGETAFTLRPVSLAAYTGKTIRVRFTYDFQGGNFIPGSDIGEGWYVDDIAFINCSEAVNLQTQSLADAGFNITPATNTPFMMQVRANMGDHLLEYGPLYSATPVVGPPEVAIDLHTVIPLSRSQIQFEFNLLSGKAPSSFTVQASDSLSATNWANESASLVSIQTLDSSHFRATITLSRGTTIRFFRILANP